QAYFQGWRPDHLCSPEVVEMNLGNWCRTGLRAATAHATMPGGSWYDTRVLFDRHRGSQGGIDVR
ncbi:MAG: hypothetical protein MK364_23525, partial [Pirellulales bacterium]|nr:hypothetical protein [Pirellulales bacterium]